MRLRIPELVDRVLALVDYWLGGRQARPRCEARRHPARITYLRTRGPHR